MKGVPGTHVPPTGQATGESIHVVCVSMTGVCGGGGDCKVDSGWCIEG